MKEILQESWTLAKRDFKRGFSILKGILLISITLALLAGLTYGLDRIVRLPEGMTYVDFFPAGIMVFLVAMVSLNEGLSVVGDKERFMKLVFVAPVSRVSIFFGKAMHTLLNTTTAFLLVGLGVLVYLGDVSFLRIILIVVVIVLVIFLFLGLGLILAVCIEKMSTLQMVNSYLNMFFLFFSGIIYPVSAMPSWLRMITYVNPLTYAADTMQFSLTGNSSIPFSFIVLIVLAVALPVLGITLFERRMRQ